MVAISNGIGARVAGGPREAKARRLITAELKRYGYQTQTLPFSTVGEGNTVRSADVVALRRGHSRREIVIGTHYDSVAVGRGALDNASGVGAALEIAQRLAHTLPHYTVRFVFFGGEEIGDAGSDAYVGHLTSAQRSRIEVMINLDSVAGGDHLYVQSPVNGLAWPRIKFLALARRLGIVLQTNPGTNPAYPYGTIPDWSDFGAFSAAGIPCAALEATNWDIGNRDGWTNTAVEGQIWHTANDTVRFVEAHFPGRLQRQLGLVVRLILRFVNDPGPLPTS
jgi:alkaline phosphatase isozyme conversion protein